MSNYEINKTDREKLSKYFPGINSGGYFWGFICHSRQDYADIVPLDGVDEIMLGIQHEQGGCLCELAFCWHMLGGKPIPRLEMYSDAWPILQTCAFAAVMTQLTEMCRTSEPTPDEVSALLIAHGFKDQSDRLLDASCVPQRQPGHEV